MMALAEKLGLKKEAVYRKARIVKGEYFDSVSYGILRDEWETLYHQQP
jgi:putative hydrolase of HD superfamily